MHVAVLDYGYGNLHTLGTALRAAGAQVQIEPDLAAALAAPALVLPAVGGFSATAARLAAGAGALERALAGGKPCLAIGLGMQLLLEGSDEGEGAGLGFIPGRARRLQTRRVPHIGWNDVAPSTSDPLFPRGGFTAWFANGCAAAPTDPEHVIAWATAYGSRFPAAVRRVNTWGVQFQPEKSGAAGLDLIRDFVSAARTR